MEARVEAAAQPGTARERPRVPAAVSSPERRTALRISTVEGMFATAHAALTGNGVGGNTMTQCYAILLGASNLHLGVLTALPQIATLAQTVAALALARLRSRRGLLLFSCTIARSAFFLAPFLPFLLGREAALVAFLALFGFASVAYQFAGLTWTSWMSDLVPASLRGRYFSRRSNLCNLIGLVSGVLGAFAVDLYSGGTGGGPASHARALLAFVAIFVGAAVLGNISTLLLVAQLEPPAGMAGRRRVEAPPSPPPAPARAAEVLAPLRDPEFRKVLTFYAAFSFASGLGNPYFIPFVLEDLGRSLSLVTLLNAVMGVVGLVTLPLWGKGLDRFGAKPCLALIVVVQAIEPLFYLVATPRFILPVWLDYIFAGAVTGGYTVALLDLVLTLSPQRGRDMYLALFAGAAGLGIALGSIIAGALADTIPGGRLALFALTAVLRLASLAPLVRLREPGARPLGEVLALARRALFGV